MSRVVALVEELPDEQLRTLREALPQGWELASSDGLANAEALLLRDGNADAGAIEAAEGLRRVVRIDMGSGGLDEEACARRGIAVEVVSSPSLATVAEHAVLSILVLLKRVVQASDELRAGKVVGGVQPEVTTQESYAYNWVGLEHWEALRGKTIGLVGLGKIGTHTARLLRAFGADVVYTKPNRLAAEDEAALGVRYASFDELLRTSRCVSLHNRFTPETEHLMDDRAFGLMPRGSYFVNTARGRLVDEDALVRALESGQLGGAALDDFWREPLPPDSPLLRLPNVLLTPHTAGIPVAESQLLELREAARLLASAGG